MFAAVALAGGLAGCATYTGDNLPASMGGLPAGAPERKAEPLAYPAVHDMPPARTNTMLTEDEVKQAEKDLTQVRSRQEQQAEPGAAAKQAKPASKKTKPKATPTQTETQAQQAQTR
jgi:hypothetical protein